jgi:NAD(P)-dependent dehydrogenase (short-subunit alcohol dehydrogenase family)
MQSFSAAATDNRDFVSDATSLAQRAVEKFGRVDRLVNNAEIVTMGWIERRADAQIDRMRAGGARHLPRQDGNGEHTSRPKGMSPVVVSAPNASLRQHRPVGRRGGESTS